MGRKAAYDNLKGHERGLDFRNRAEDERHHDEAVERFLGQFSARQLRKAGRGRKRRRRHSMSGQRSIR